MEQHWPGDEGGVVRRRLVAGALTCLVVVVLTHLAEHWHIFPGMGWGLPSSPAHYLDLSSAILGLALLLAALICKRNSD
jgi:hypothetical protein